MNHPFYVIGLLAIVPWGYFFGPWGVAFQFLCLGFGIANIVRLLRDE